MRSLKCWLDAALSFFYPEVCQYCDERRATALDGYICETCARQAKFIAPPFCQRCGLPFAGDITVEFECSNCRDMELHFSYARSAVAAHGMVLELIHRYKYQRALWLEPFLARLFTQAATPSVQEGGWQMIVPVPLHRQKRLEREYNQAERLARWLSASSEIPLTVDALQRATPTRSQTRLSRQARAANVHRAFSACSRPGLKNKRVVLVDDVFTTGATTSACAQALREAGAADVCVWTLARGLFH